MSAPFDPATEPPLYSELKGKRVLITGASRGIGAGLARAFARQGCRLVLHFNASEQEMFALAGEIRSARESPETELRVLQCDFRDVDTVADFSRRALEALGGIDVVVNNAGIVPKEAALAASETDFDEIVAVNLRAPFAISRAAAQRMLRTGVSGAIVNISSIHAARSAESFALYAMTKAALEAMTRVEATEWAPHGIRVNAIAPGVTLVERNRAGLEANERTWLPHLPAGRFGAVEDIAAAALFLASGQARWMTGMTLTVDGGQTARGNTPFCDDLE